MACNKIIEAQWSLVSLKAVYISPLQVSFAAQQWRFEKVTPEILFEVCTMEWSQYLNIFSPQAETWEMSFCMEAIVQLSLALGSQSDLHGQMCAW